MTCIYFSTFRIALTKLDILDSLPELKICTGYKLRGEKLDRFPASEADLRDVEVTDQQHTISIFNIVSGTGPHLSLMFMNYEIAG